MRILMYLLVFYLGAACADRGDDWIDPTDMGRSSGWLKRGRDPEVGGAAEAAEGPGARRDCCGDHSVCAHYLTRFVNLLIRGSKLESLKLSDDESVEEVSLVMKVRGRDLKVLRAFGSGSSTADIELVDQIISDLFLQAPGLRSYFSMPTVPTGTISSYISPIPIFVFFVCGLIILFMWHVYSGYSYQSAAFLLYFIIFLMSFGLECFSMYNDKVVEQKSNLMKTESAIPVECTPSKMTIWQSVGTYFKSKDKCEQYFRTVETHPFSNVKLGDAFAKTFHLMVFGTLSKLGVFIHDVLGGISDKLIFPLNYILYVLLVVLAVLYLCYSSLLSFTRLRFSSLFCSFEMERPTGLSFWPDSKPTAAKRPTTKPSSETDSARIQLDTGTLSGAGDKVQIVMNHETFLKMTAPRAMAVTEGDGDRARPGGSRDLSKSPRTRLDKNTDKLIKASGDNSVRRRYCLTDRKRKMSF